MADVMVATALGAFPDPAADYALEEQRQMEEEEQYQEEEIEQQGMETEYVEEAQDYAEEDQAYTETEGAFEAENNEDGEGQGAEESMEETQYEEEENVDGEQTWEGEETYESEEQAGEEERQEEGLEEGLAEAAQDSDSTDDRPIQLVITVEIEEGRSDRIEMREGDSPRQLAIQFCESHGLDDSVIEPLTEHILDNIAQLQARGGLSQEVTETVEETTVEYQDVVEEEKTVIEQTRAVTASNSQRSVASRERASPDRLTRPTKASVAKSKSGQELEKQARPVSAPSFESSERTVYSRLYEDSEKQAQKLEEEKRRLEHAKQEAIGKDKIKISKKSEQMMRGRTAKEYENYGELLYVEGKIQAEQRRKLVEQRKLQEQQREVQGLTLKPEISHLAKSMKRPDDVPWNRLAAQPTTKQKKLADLKIQLEEAKLAECTFQPQINPKTRKLMAERSEVLRVHHISHYDQLFQDAERRKVRHKEYSNWYPEDVTFQPNRVTKSKSRSEADSDEEVDRDLFDRLYRSAEKIQAKREKLKEELQKPVDHVTGRKLFKPQIGRPPSFKRGPNRKNVGEYLYSIRHEFEDRKETLVARERLLKEELANKKYVNKASLDLLGRMRTRRFQQIFKYLDKDKDGTVDLAASDLDALDSEVKEDIQDATKLAGDEPLVEFERFNELMTAVLESCKTGPRKYILPDSQRSGDANRDMTFSYKMGRKSREMAERRRRSDLTPEQWYQMQLLERKRISERIEKLKAEKMQQEMAECTFRPGINASAAEGRLKAMLARPKAEGKHRTAEERIASLERELRDVHGFILGNAAQAKDVPAWSPETEPLSFTKALAGTASQATSKSRNLSMTSVKEEQPTKAIADVTNEESDSEEEREQARDLRSRMQALGSRAKADDDELPEALRAVKRSGAREAQPSDEESEEDEYEESSGDDTEEEEEQVRRPSVRANVTKTSYSSRRADDSDTDDSDLESEGEED